MTDAQLLQRREQAAAAYRTLAETLGDFRAHLLEVGFTPMGAEQIVDTLTAAILVST